jgi:hypothetical protein
MNHLMVSKIITREKPIKQTISINVLMIIRRIRTENAEFRFWKRKSLKKREPASSKISKNWIKNEDIHNFLPNIAKALPKTLKTALIKSSTFYHCKLITSPKWSKIPQILMPNFHEDSRVIVLFKLVQPFCLVKWART